MSPKVSFILILEMESLEMMFTGSPRAKNLMTVCCAAVLTFGLAACGSSSDDDNVLAVTDATPTATTP